MSTATIALSNPQVQRSTQQTATIYLKEARYEFLKNLRLRMYTASVLSFPIMFYVLFGLVLNSKESIGSMRVPTYLIATYGTFGVMGASLFGTAAGLASDRGLGWLQVKRASPMPPFAYFAAKVVTSMIFSAIIVMALFTLGDHDGRSAHARRRLCANARNPGRRIATFLGHGTGSRIFHRTELGSGDDQPDLSADVVLQRTVGTVHVPAEDCEADCTGAAAISLVTAGARGSSAREVMNRQRRIGKCWPRSP